MLIGEFTRNVTGHLRDVVLKRKALELENYRREYVTVVPTDVWRRAEAAMLREAERELASGEVSEQQKLLPRRAAA